ncbi:MAG: competence/damage-inducible protein A [Nitrososphaerota archaeon]|jgi:molybdenum cofactor synthesis domain-containing protein|nr:molybdopterin-binding protein [Nitrososphaerota archaeon]MDG6927154.1 competence/damage-inducible protein A [Nitrososphaerota archaeon]MDG6931162.1 competence/damage-inducible protein A [Nitrososphaerota archaeon]MDG6932302.1 competence/damage-inducible protein A [Nitrososphaerota archaeon]MDG6936478.1 competence/damage-inducible protein A [Nitrososphaerota archaeon]
MLKVEIINVGNELLIGRTVNQNLFWLGARIFDLGGYLKRATIIRDIKSDIAEAIAASVGEGPDLILTTGGLGPTYDDITMGSVAHALGLKMKLNDQAVKFMTGRRTPESENVRLAYEKMATLPEGSTPLFNYAGSAPGALIERGHTKIVIMPGVPAEMQDMFTRYVEPMFGSNKSKEIVILTENIYEAELAPLVAKMADKYPQVYIKTHPASESGISRVKIELKTQFSDNAIDAEYNEIETWLKQNGVKFSVQ